MDSLEKGMKMSGQGWRGRKGGEEIVEVDMVALLVDCPLFF